MKKLYILTAILFVTKISVASGDGLEEAYKNLRNPENFEYKNTLAWAKKAAESGSQDIIDKALYNLISNQEAVKILLDAGANPNMSLYNGQSVLYLAVKSHNFPVVEQLLNAGADPNLYNHNASWSLGGRSILEAAVLNDNNHYGSKDEILEIVKKLIDAGADVTRLNQYKDSILVNAQTSEMKEILNEAIKKSKN